MSSLELGKSTSEVEVTHISAHGVWILAGDRELFMPFEDFPWFKEASIQEVLHVEQPVPGHYYWPDLDVDLGLESSEHPDRFPLRYRNP